MLSLAWHITSTSLYICSDSCS